MALSADTKAVLVRQSQRITAILSVAATFVVATIAAIAALL